MSESFRALCDDFYVNQKVQVKLDLPKSRETVLDLFERFRRSFPAMQMFRRFRDELALESPQTDAPHRWLAVRANTLRSGTVNPQNFEEAYALPAQVLEFAPAYLSLSALDIDFIELLYGFDLAASANHDAIVLEALMPGSPLAALVDVPGTSPIDCQPVVGLSMGQRGDLEIYFEVKTRAGGGATPKPAEGPEPISVYLTLRKFGPFGDVKDLPGVLYGLARQGESLLEKRVAPGLLAPIRAAIASGNG